MIPLIVIVNGDVRVAFCMCAGTASDVRSVECGRATVMRRAVGLSVSKLPAMTAYHFSVALGFPFPFALVQVIDFHVVI